MGLKEAITTGFEGREIVKWEYDIIAFEDSKAEIIVNFLDEAGRKGWELVSVDNGAAYLKKPVLNKIIPKKLTNGMKIELGWMDDNQNEPMRLKG